MWKRKKNSKYQETLSSVVPYTAAHTAVLSSYYALICQNRVVFILANYLNYGQPLEIATFAAILTQMGFFLFALKKPLPCLSILYEYV